MSNQIVMSQPTFVPFTGVPGDRADYRQVYPVYTQSTVNQAKAAIMMKAKVLGADNKTLTILETYLDTYWAPAVVRSGEWAERNRDGMVTITTGLVQARVDFIEKMDQEQLPVSLGVTVADMNDEGLASLWAMLEEDLHTSEVGSITSKPTEVFLTKTGKMLLAMPQAFLMMKAFGGDPTSSIVGLVFSLGLAFTLSHVYQHVARAVVESHSDLSAIENSQGIGPRLKKGGLLAQFAVFAPGFFAVAICGALLDATVITTTTAFDRFGNPNPHAIPFSTALFLASAFTGLLALASLAVARRDRAKHDIGSRVRARVAQARGNTASHAAVVRSHEKNLQTLADQQDELFAASDAQWLRMLCALVGIYRQLPSEGIALFLLNAGDQNSPSVMHSEEIEDSEPQVQPKRRFFGLFGK